MPLGGKNSSPLAAGYRLKPSNTSSTSRGRACRGRLAGPRQFRAVMRALAIERAHVVGLSMGGYAALQFGLRYPEKASAIVAAAAGSGSLPSQRHAWLRETSVLARVFTELGMGAMAERMTRGPARIQHQDVYLDQSR